MGKRFGVAYQQSVAPCEGGSVFMADCGGEDFLIADVYKRQV